MASADFWRLITAIGDFQTVVAIILISLIIYAVSSKSKKHRIAWLALVLVTSLLASTALAEIIKISTQIPRPCIGSADCPSGYSFPSRHAATMFALVAAVWLNIKNFRIKLTFLALAMLVSISRVVLGYHTHLDILGGAILGISIAYIAHYIYRRSLQT